MTRSQSDSLARSVVPVIRFSAASRSAADIFSFLTRRSRLPPTVDSPRFTAASEMSTITTESPAAAQICAMPFPMVPAPMMPTVWIIASYPSHPCGRAARHSPLFLHPGLAPPEGGRDLIRPFLKASMAGIKPLPGTKRPDFAARQAILPEFPPRLAQRLRAEGRLRRHMPERPRSPPTGRRGAGSRVV